MSKERSLGNVSVFQFTPGGKKTKLTEDELNKFFNENGDAFFPDAIKLLESGHNKAESDSQNLLNLFLGVSLGIFGNFIATLLWSWAGKEDLTIRQIYVSVVSFLIIGAICFIFLKYGLEKHDLAKKYSKHIQNFTDAHLINTVNGTYQKSNLKNKTKE